MKKLLALVLALVMTLSLCTISNAAYSDAKDVDYKEAVDVMSAVGVFQGADGKFSPKAELTREQAAKLIAYLDLGESVAEALPATKVFNDVEASRWSSKYVAYCADAGYLAGVGNGNFDPAGKLTGYAFGKMLLCVLGYDAAIEGFTGANWQIKVAALMQSNDIAKSVDASSSATLTREAAAQYCLNALKATMVEYDDKGTTITGNGLTITTGAKKAEVQTWGAAGTGCDYTTGAVTVAPNETKELCEKLYGTDLALDTVVDNGRQSRSWTYKTETVGDTAAFDTVLATSTNGTAFDKLITKGKTGYIGVKADDEITVYENGAAFTTGANTVAPNNTFSTSNATELAALIAEGQNHDDIGDVIEFIDTNDNGKWDTVAITSYTFTKVTKTTAEKADGTEATVNFRGIPTAIKESEIKGDFAGLAKDDYVFYAHIINAVADNYYLVYEATSFTGKMTGYNTGKHTMTIGGETKTATTGVTNATTLTAAAGFTGKDESTFYTDKFGYVVAVDGIEAADNYAVVDKLAWINPSQVDDGTGYAQAVLFFTDGTKATVKVSKLNSIAVTSNGAANGVYNTAKVADLNGAGNNDTMLNCIYTYKIDKNDKYELTKVADSAASEAIKKGTAAVGNLATANADTVYLYKTLTGTSTVVMKNYTGYTNAPSVTAAANVHVAAAVKSGYAKFVYVNAYANTASVGDTTTDVVVFLSDSVYTDKSGDDTLYVYQAAVNGVEGEYKSENALTFVINTLYDVKVDKDGYIDDKDNTAHDFTDDTAVTGFNYRYATADAKAGVLKIDSAVNTNFSTLSFDGSEKVYFIGDETITEGAASDIKEGMFFWVKTNSTSTTDIKGGQMKTVYVLDEIAAQTAPTLTIGIGATNNAPATALNDSTALTATSTNKYVNVKIAGGSAVSFITIDGAGTDTSKSGDATTALTTGSGNGEYTVVTGDLNKTITVTVKSYAPGKTAVIESYKVSVTGSLGA